MRFDVTRFKKIKSDNTHSTLVHPDGHTIVLEHSKLRPEVKKILEKLPLADDVQHLNKGGEVNRGPASGSYAGSNIPKRGFADIPEQKLKAHAESVAKEHPLDPYFLEGAKIAGIDPYLFKTIAANEGGLLPGADNHGKNKAWNDPARGVMQLKSSAIKDIENEGFKILDPHDAKQNILGAAHYLNALKKQLSSRDPEKYKDGVPVEDLIGAYNMGAKNFYDATYKGKQLDPKLQSQYAVYAPLAVGSYNYGQANKLFQKPIEGSGANRSPQGLVFDNEKPVKKSYSAFEAGEPVNAPQGFDNSTQKHFGPESPSAYGPGANIQVPYSPEYWQKLQQQKQSQETTLSPHYGPGATFQPQQIESNPLHSTSIPAAEYWNKQEARPDIQGVLDGKYPEAQRPLPALTQQQSLDNSQQRAQEPKPQDFTKTENALQFDQQLVNQPNNQAQQQQQGSIEDPMGYKWLQNQLSKGYGAQQNAALMQSQNYENTAREVNKLIDQQNKEYKVLVDRRNEYNNLYNQEAAKIVNDLSNTKTIDPNRWIHSNVSTVPQKIMTALGLLFSGFGSGLSGQENLAARWLKDQIDRDIDAQKANFSNNENMLRGYTDYFQNASHGLDMTEAVIKNYYAQLIQKELNTKEANTQSNEALKLIAQLQNEAAVKIQELAQKSAMSDFMFKMLQQGGGGRPEAQIRAYEMMGMIRPEQAQGMYKQVQEYNNNVAKIQQMDHAFSELAELSTLASKGGAPFQTKNRIAALEAELLGPLSRDLAGKFSEFEANTLRQALPKITDNAETVAKKLRDFRTTLGNVMNMPGFKPNFPELSGYGINLPGYVPTQKRSMPPGYQR